MAETRLLNTLAQCQDLIRARDRPRGEDADHHLTIVHGLAHPLEKADPIAIGRTVAGEVRREGARRRGVEADRFLPLSEMSECAALLQRR